MNIFYIASVRIPNEKASGLAIMRQCEAFVDAGHAVTLIRPYRTNHITEDAFIYYGIEKKFAIETLSSIDFHQKAGVIGFYVARLSQMIAGALYLFKHRNEVDVIYARDPWMLVLPVIFFRRKKIIWEAHQAQSGRCVRLVASKASLLVCISEGLRLYYAKWRQKEILLEPSGVNLSQFAQLPDISVVRGKYNVPDDAKVVGYIGKYKTMGEEKGVDDLIDVCARLYQGNKNLFLFIVGLEESEINIVKESCLNKGLPEESFRLLPLVQKDFAYYVQVADVLVMNYPNTQHYRDYMSPTKLFAYMGSKKRVVASDLSSIRSIADESMITFVIPGDTQSLAEGIQEALRQEDDNRLERGYHRVQKYAWLPRGERILMEIGFA